MQCKTDISKTRDLGVHKISRPELRVIQSPLPGKRKERLEQEALPQEGLWQPVSLLCGIVGWNFPLGLAVPYRAFPFGVPDSTLWNAPPSLNAPPKGFELKWFCAHLSGKNVFTEKFKLKLSYSTGNVQNQMQIERLQMQIVLFKGLFWRENYRWTGYG